ncbi:MAG: TolB family protein [Anaerolineae bacterium]
MMRLLRWSLGFLSLVAVAGCATSQAATQPPLETDPPASPAIAQAVETSPPLATSTTRPVPSATATPTPRPTLTPLPTATLQPTGTPTPTPSPTPSLRQLTGGGCCVQPFFSPDSSMVLFIDRPAEDASPGIYGVDLAAAGSEAVLVDETIGFRSPDRTIVARPVEGNGRLMRFEDERTGQTWTVDTNGNWPVFSPDGREVYWNATDRDGPYDERRTDIWLANVDGSQARIVASVFGGGAMQWFPDGQRLLMSGRAERIGEEESLFVLSLSKGTTLELAREERLRGGEVSPDGTWVAYFITFSGEPERDGIWLVRADGTERRRLDFFGPYRWRDDSHLVYIPLRASSSESMVLWELDVNSGQHRPLTDPEALWFTVANGDWELSPDGKKVVFVSGQDKNLWLITLP